MGTSLRRTNSFNIQSDIYSIFTQVSKLDAHILRLEQKLDEKDQDLYHAKLEARNKAKYLKQTIQDLRRQFSGSLPLLKQEIFAEAMRNLQDSKLKLQQDLDKVSLTFAPYSCDPSSDSLVHSIKVSLITVGILHK